MGPTPYFCNNKDSNAATSQAWPGRLVLPEQEDTWPHSLRQLRLKSLRCRVILVVASLRVGWGAAAEAPDDDLTNPELERVKAFTRCVCACRAVFGLVWFILEAPLDRRPRARRHVDFILQIRGISSCTRLFSWTRRTRTYWANWPTFEQLPNHIEDERGLLWLPFVAPRPAADTWLTNGNFTRDDASFYLPTVVRPIAKRE